MFLKGMVHNFVHNVPKQFFTMQGSNLEVCKMHFFDIAASHKDLLRNVKHV